MNLLPLELREERERMKNERINEQENKQASKHLQH